MKCKKCGEELPENARFCPGCGSPVEGVPAPKKLEAPIDPLVGGAVPLVPVAPPPRASRMTPRIPRPYVPHSNQRSSRYSTSSRYGSSYAFGQREMSAIGADKDDAAKDGPQTPVQPQTREKRREAVAKRRREIEAEKRARHAAETAPEAEEPTDVAAEPEVEAAETAAAVEVAAEAVEATVVEPESDVAGEPRAEKGPEAEKDVEPEPDEGPEPEEAPADVEAEPAPAPEQPAEPAEDSAVESEPEDDEALAEKTGRLYPVAAPAAEPRPAPEPQPASEPVPPAGPSLAERARELAGHAGELAGRAKDAVVDAAHEAAARFEALGPDRVPVIAVAAVILVVVGVALAYVSTGWFSPFADRTVEAPQFEEPSDGSVEPIQPEQAEEEPEEGPVEGGPEIRDTLQAYSWAELSQLSALIAAAPSDEEGIEIARRYNLCAESGSIDANNTKSLELSSGAVVPVAVGGFRHDQKTDGSGVAGITFIARASAGNQAIDPSGIATAWEETPLRSWLNQSLMAEIPADLAELVVAVDKTTNLPIAYGGGQSVTSEYLWIPSYSEIVGPLDQSARRYGIYTSEGEQYQLYADSGVTSVSESAALAIGEYWWTRSPDVVTDYWYLVVSPEGGTPYGHRTGTPDAIILGFCL